VFLAGVDFAAARVVRAVVDLLAAARLAAVRVVAVASAMVASSGMDSGGLWIDCVGLGWMSAIQLRQRCEMWQAGGVCLRGVGGGYGHGLCRSTARPRHPTARCAPPLLLTTDCSRPTVACLVPAWVEPHRFARGSLRSHRARRGAHIGICLDPVVRLAPVV